MLQGEDMDGFDDLLSDEPESLNTIELDGKTSSITEFQRDSLRELANIAAGVATTSLSNFVKKEVRLGLPYMDILPAKELPIFMGDSNQKVIIAYSNLSGSLSGKLVTVIPDISGFLLFDLSVGNPEGTTKDVTAVMNEKLVEVSSVISKFYMESLNDFLDLEIQAGDAQLTDLTGKMLSQELEVGEDAMALILEADFSIPGSNFEGDFVLLADEKSTQMLLDAVTEKLS